MNLLPLVTAARGRRISVHVGADDYTAARNITAPSQHLNHSACDFAREVMPVALAGTGTWLSDGATNTLPLPPNRTAQDGTPLSARQIDENRSAVHQA